MIPISTETHRRIRMVFPSDQWQTVEALLLAECGDNLPSIKSDYIQLAERIRFAVLKLSEGDLAKLRNWLNDAAVDWRDTLVSAGFGCKVEDHLKWLPTDSDHP